MRRRLPAAVWPSWRKVRPSDYVLLALVILGILLFLWLLLPHPRMRPISVEQAQRAAEAFGITPTALKKNDLTSAETQGICYDDRRVSFRFYQMQNEVDAKAQEAAAISKIRQIYRTNDAAERSEGKGNYRIYALDSLHQFGFAARVGSTVVFLRCDSDLAQTARQFLEQIGYWEAPQFFGRPMPGLRFLNCIAHRDALRIPEGQV